MKAHYILQRHHIPLKAKNVYFLQRCHFWRYYLSLDTCLCRLNTRQLTGVSRTTYSSMVIKTTITGQGRRFWLFLLCICFTLQGFLVIWYAEMLAQIQPSSSCRSVSTGIVGRNQSPLSFRMSTAILLSCDPF